MQWSRPSVIIAGVVLAVGIFACESLMIAAFMGRTDPIAVLMSRPRQPGPIWQPEVEANKDDPASLANAWVQSRVRERGARGCRIETNASRKTDGNQTLFGGDVLLANADVAGQSSYRWEAAASLHDLAGGGTAWQIDRIALFADGR
jgi:hypothetical protein